MKNQIKRLLTLTLIIAPILHARRGKRIHNNQPSHTSSAIIFDATGVLFKENKTGFAQKIGFGTLARYTFTHWKNPGHTCLDMLATMSCDPTHQPKTEIKFKGRVMPQCILDLHQGTKTCSQAREEIHEYIETLDNKGHFASRTEKSLTRDIITLILDPDQLPDLTKPIMPMVKLARQLKKAGNQLYLLANIPNELFQAITTAYPDIIKLFDGVIISSQVNMVKPDTQIFSHLLNTYQLDSEKCVLIDEQEESLAAAQKVGITGIYFNKPPVVVRKLKQLGIRL